MIKYGDFSAGPAFLLPGGGADEEELKKTAAALTKLTGDGRFALVRVPADDWNKDLSPWEAPPVFGNEAFGNGADALLMKIETEVIPAIEREYPIENREFYLAGYSLAGLFALYAGTRTACFSGVAGVSPSAWFPGFTAYLRSHPVLAKKVYLSLGDREERTRHPVLRTVGDEIRAQYRILQEAGKETVLEWNPGNHFVDSSGRIAKGMAWLLGKRTEGKT